MKLKEYLESQGITVQQFAKTTGMSRASIYMYLHGRVPHMNNVKIISIATKGRVLPEDLGYDITYKVKRSSNSKRNRKNNAIVKGSREPH